MADPHHAPSGLTHLDPEGRVRMVDVGDKAQPLGMCCRGCGTGRGRSGGDELCFPRLVGQRGDPVRRGLRRDEPRTGSGPLFR